MQDFLSNIQNDADIQSEKVVLNKSYERLLKENNFSDLISFMSAPVSNSYRNVPGRLTVGIDLDNDGNSQRVYLKRHWSLKKSKGTGPHKEALAEWNNINSLTNAKIKVPEAMAVGHGFINGHSVGFIMMKEVEGIPADDYIKEHLNDKAPFLTKKQFIEDLALFASEFHELGYNHRDFYLCHTFVKGNEPNNLLNLIDLQRVQKRSVFRRRWIVKDLAQMAYSSLKICSKSDRLRFYLNYVGNATLSAQDKKFIRAIQNKVDTMVKRELEGKVR